MIAPIKAPFPYFGGKRLAAQLVWDRFGDVPHYIEPFFGSGAILLSRPHEAKYETVNDIDSYLCNFWRAIKADPESVAAHANHPVMEQDLHARHLWLINQAEFRERMMVDPEFFDVKVAGWWVWGLCCWIGSGWCKHAWRQRPHMGNAGRGVNRQRPHMTKSQGINRQLPHVGGAGRGIKRQLPHVSNADRTSDLIAYFGALADRLSRVRVACGDWMRVLSSCVISFVGGTPAAVFLDPPYSAEAKRGADLYLNDSLDVAHDVRAWAIANGDNPDLRICLAGYEGEHEMPHGWECVAWKAKGGYASGRKHGENKNAHRERLWFSPYCLNPTRDRMPLFAGFDDDSGMGEPAFTHSEYAEVELHP